MQDVVGRRVHGLTALYHLIYTEILEYADQSVACGNRDKAVFLLRLGNFALLAFQTGSFLDDLRGVLLAHVLNLDGEQLAELQTCFERLVRAVGVYVNLDDIVVINNNKAVADAVEERAQALYIARLIAALCDKFGAVGKRDILVLDVRERRTGLCMLRLSSDFALLVDAVIRVVHALEDGQEAEAACIDDARLFQNRVLVRGLCQCLMALVDGGAQNLAAVDVRVGLTQLEYMLCRNAGNGQNGAFRRLHDCLVRRLYALMQSECKILSLGSLALFQLLGHAAEQQRQNDAGIAACAAQQCGCRRRTRCRQVGLGQLGYLIFRRRHRQRHIGSGITVRNREYIQLICFFFFFFNGQCALDDHSAE